MAGQSFKPVLLPWFRSLIYIQITAFAFLFRSAKLSIQIKRSLGILECSAPCFSLLESPGFPGQLGGQAPHFCAHTTRAVYSAPEPISLICLFHEQFLFISDRFSPTFSSTLQFPAQYLLSWQHCNRWLKIRLNLGISVKRKCLGTIRWTMVSAIKLWVKLDWHGLTLALIFVLAMGLNVRRWVPVTSLSLQDWGHRAPPSLATNKLTTSNAS